MTQRQCTKCPWRQDVDARTIPNGYDRLKHERLRETVAVPGALDLGPVLRLMACHDSRVGRERPCVGWLHHQLTVGSNIALRIAVFRRRIPAEHELVGPQRERFEDTLPPEDV
jgi:Family of unknown function (DUF6283)